MYTLHTTSQADAEPLTFLIWTRELSEDTLSWGPGRCHKASHGLALPSSLPLPWHGLQPTGHLLPPHVSACPLSGPLLLPFSCLGPSSDVCVLLGFQVTAQLSLSQRGLSRSPGLKGTPHAAPPRPSRLHFLSLYLWTMILFVYLCTCFLSFFPCEVTSSTGQGLYCPPAPSLGLGPGDPRDLLIVGGRPAEAFHCHGHLL